jgi:hypothetical protein
MVGAGREQSTMSDQTDLLRARLADPGMLAAAALGAMAALSFMTFVTSGVLDDYDPGVVHTLFALLIIVGWLFTAVVFILWLYVVRETLELRGETGLRWSRTRPVTSWFVPVTNLWVPMLIVAEVYHRSDPLGYRAVSWRVIAWWCAFVPALLMFASHEFAVVNASVLLHYGVGLNMLYGGLGFMSALWGVQIVGNVTGWQERWEPTA